MSFKYNNKYQIKKDIDFSNSINNSHWKTETNTNTTINNYIENQSNCINYNNDNNNQSLDKYIENEDNEENYDKFGITNSPKFSNSPANIDEMIKNEMSSAVIDSFLNENQIKSIPMFILYLSEIWQGLSKEANSQKYQDMGINLFSFNKYYNLPGLIGQRLFNIFDMDHNGFCLRKNLFQGCALFFVKK